MPAVLDRAELEASPLADLHAIADQLGLDGFRRLRKAELIDRIVGDEAGDSAAMESDADSPRATTASLDALGLASAPRWPLASRRLVRGRRVRRRPR